MADEEKKTAPTTEETATTPATASQGTEEVSAATEDKPAAAAGATTTNGASAPAANTSATPAPVTAPLAALPDESTEDSVVQIQSSADNRREESANRSRVILETRHSEIQIREHDGILQSPRHDRVLRVLMERRESSYTASITSSITAYQQENGRRYHAYQAGRYVLPNDEAEQDRLDLQYHAFRLAFGDQTHFAPIAENVERILDVGTGTGIWAVDMADKFPESQITGIDLSPIQPQWVPQNVKFEVDDAEQEWTFPPDHFDFIHTRIMTGCLVDWAKFYRQAFDHLKPGAWLESQEMDLEVHTDDNSIPSDSYVRKWCENCEIGMQKIGNSLRQPHHDLPGKIRAAGFVNVEVREFKIPIGTWPADPKLRETGTFQLVALLEGLQGLTLALWTRVLGWSTQEIEVFLAKVRQEWKSRKVHTWWPVYSITAQKPAA